MSCKQAHKQSQAKVIALQNAALAMDCALITGLVFAFIAYFAA